MRKQMEQDEQLATLMRGLRGQNLRDEQFADDNVRLRLVEVNLLDPTSVNLSPSVLSSSITSYQLQNIRITSTTQLHNIN